MIHVLHNQAKANAMGMEGGGGGGGVEDIRRVGGA